MTTHSQWIYWQRFCFPMNARPQHMEPSVPRLCIVMPCYNEEAGLVATIDIVLNKLNQLKTRGAIDKGSTMLFSDDGSRDETWNIIRAAHNEYPRTVKAVRLAANRGKEYALWAGIMEARTHADIVVCMDADLQFDIDAIDKFLALHAQGYELVYGIKKTRGDEPIYKRLFSRVFYTLMECLGSPIQRNHTDYCLMTRHVCDALAEYGETNIIFRGLLKQLGFKQSPCYFEVKDRAAGESHFSPIKLINLSLDAITSFSVAPLRLIVFIGGVVFLIGLAMIIWTISDAFKGITPGGYATLACSLWFLGGLGMMCLGVVGEYLGKLYMEAKKRPRYYISSKLF
ncbi:MAG: glycosyltransferase family 2 protein [Akkermansia sp.]|nr:glycosyltransferase family 2 protein [Akkermansia sp.]